MGRQWTLREERYIQDNIQIKSAQVIAHDLDRTYGALRNHCTRMRQDGRLEGSLRVPHDHDVFDTVLEECVECYQWRATCDKYGVCSVCRSKKRLEHHKELLEHTYLNLPQEIKDTVNGNLTVKRAPELMSKSKNLQRPPKPDTTDMNEFERDYALDAWYRATEAYELAMLRLDIDATKQKRSKWMKKIKKYKQRRKK